MVIVLKFGGSSISKNGFDSILGQIKINNCKKVIVLSAMYNITNSLIKLVDDTNLKIIDEIIETHYKLLEELDLKKSILGNLINELKLDCSNITKKNIPKIISYGERFTTLILNQFLSLNSIKSKLINGYDIIKTKNLFENMSNKAHMKGEFYCEENIKMDFLILE